MSPLTKCHKQLLTDALDGPSARVTLCTKEYQEHGSRTAEGLVKRGLIVLLHRRPRQELAHPKGRKACCNRFWQYVYGLTKAGRQVAKKLVDERAEIERVAKSERRESALTFLFTFDWASKDYEFLVDAEAAIRRLLARGVSHPSEADIKAAKR